MEQPAYVLWIHYTACKGCERGVYVLVCAVLRPCTYPQEPLVAFLRSRCKLKNISDRPLCHMPCA